MTFTSTKPSTSHGNHCHYGNVPVFSYGAGTFYAGGTSHGIEYVPGWIMIDLNGANHTKYGLGKAGADDARVYNHASKERFQRILDAQAGKAREVLWLTMNVPDMQTPSWSKEVWDEFIRLVTTEMEAGTNFIMGCIGGHGRTGMILAILVKALGVDTEGLDPVTWVRKVYCSHAVEKQAQIDYVFDFFEDLREVPKKDRPKGSAEAGGSKMPLYTKFGGKNDTGAYQYDCNLCSKNKTPHKDNYLCNECYDEEEARAAGTLKTTPFELDDDCIVCQKTFKRKHNESTCAGCLKSESQRPTPGPAKVIEVPTFPSGGNNVLVADDVVGKIALTKCCVCQNKMGVPQGKQRVCNKCLHSEKDYQKTKGVIEVAPCKCRSCGNPFTARMGSWLCSKCIDDEDQKRL